MESKRVWDNYKVVSEVQKNDRLKFVIAAGVRDGFRCISIREFYYRKRDNTWCPGRDGIVIPIKSPINAGRNAAEPVKFIEPGCDLLAALPNAIDIVSTMALHDPDHEVWYPAKEG